jgi:nucleoredoxin
MGTTSAAKKAKESATTTATATSTIGSQGKAGHPLEALLGPVLLTHTKDQKTTTTIPTATALSDSKLVLLYFSASWCPPCQHFTPILANFAAQFAATTLRSAASKFTVVYVSSDKSIHDFDAYFAKMPWLAVPLLDHDGYKIRTKLAKDTFAIKGIPTLIVLDATTGLFVTADARNQIMATAALESDAVYQKVVVEQWLHGPRLTLEQAVAAPGYVWQAFSLIFKGLVALLTNPMYIFGTVYLVRWAVRKYYAKDGDAVPVMTDSPDNAPVADDEF